MNVTNVVSKPVTTLRTIVLLVEASEWWVQTVALIESEAIMAINVKTTRCAGLAKVIVNNGIMAPMINEQNELAAAWRGIKISFFCNLIGQFSQPLLVAWSCFSNVFSWISLCVLTEIHSPPAMEQAPASIPDKPLIKRVLLSRLAPAAPRTIPETEIMPSLAPRILARLKIGLID